MIPAGLATRFAGFGLKDYIIAFLSALVLILAVTTYLSVHFLFIGYEGWKPWGERMEANWEGAEERLKTSNDSIDLLEGELAKFIGAGKASQIAQLAAIEKQAPKSLAMRSRAEEIRAMIETIEPDDQCRTPDFVMGD